MLQSISCNTSKKTIDLSRLLMLCMRMEWAYLLVVFAKTIFLITSLLACLITRFVELQVEVCFLLSFLLQKDISLQNKTCVSINGRYSTRDCTVFLILENI